jgi:hypothetical protein
MGGVIYCVLTVWLHCTPTYRIGTSGAYRDDTSYLEQCAQRIAMLQRVAFSMGMNCYVSRVTQLRNTRRGIAITRHPPEDTLPIRAAPRTGFRVSASLPLMLCLSRWRLTSTGCPRTYRYNHLNFVVISRSSPNCLWVASFAIALLRGFTNWSTSAAVLTLCWISLGLAGVL